MELTTVYDCTGSNLDTLPVPPRVLMAGYDTGTDGVAWTDQQFAQFPNALHIWQSPQTPPNTATFDAYDLETDAGTIVTLPVAIHNAQMGYRAALRPGQRQPVMYMSRGNVTPAVNALIAHGITSGVGIWLAEPCDAAQAANLVDTASGPFPIIGVQYQFLQDHDVSVFSTAWLTDVSGKPAAPPAKPGTQTGWRWCFKCQGLFYGPQENRSHCPAGGMHNGSKSHEYTLGFDQ